MRYASIRNFDITNGEGIGIALFVQGCDFHCNGCFNSSTWDFTGGKEWDSKTEEQFIDLASKEYVERITILGGEPMHPINRDLVFLKLSLYQIVYLSVYKKYVPIYHFHS